MNLKPSNSKRLIVWDDTCGFCRTSVGWLRRLDWLHRFEFAGASRADTYAHTGITPEQAQTALQLSQPRSSGYEALVHIAAALPASFLFAPLLRIAPVRWLGWRLYRWVAARRRCSYPHSSPS